LANTELANSVQQTGKKIAIVNNQLSFINNQLSFINNQLSFINNQLSVIVACDSLGLAHTSAVLLRGFFIICVALHIPYQTLFFAQLLKTPYHLLNRFACTRPDL